MKRLITLVSVTAVFGLLVGLVAIAARFDVRPRIGELLERLDDFDDESAEEPEAISRKKEGLR
jgi:hypothetical protein